MIFLMPRLPRVAVGDVPYHVINRANGRARIFHDEKDYRHFESLLLEGVELIDMRILAYCIMPNHWHLVLYPRKDGDMSEFMRWITTTHVRQRRVQTKTVGGGHLYQGSYKSFPIQEDQHLITVIRYVEQNPLRARLVDRAERWPYSSLYRRMRDNKEDKKLLASFPTALPKNYLSLVNNTLNKEALESLRTSVKKGAPYGSTAWTNWMIEEYDMESTTREPGRPKGS